ncbi:hypothetical protein PPL_12624 [Heterostelium album PN500]|uniref:THH1/TOM1/TOM3 domain-containing protein n=1 Tax=Heterostelium pallidum (strain ATCC 26659 / Pp 5 / PN500) TaxID=670386 RepID=D3BN46_HETP5|nr:hypothetical protein PPL_12624 [Heterostelium album PN500]EFA77408.1 hypothetical protein PPL_12624 [Heterostelium album PN500]|eukprot:XP_020429537.1 hypothetical protein PPL_12624 [Heterostelium album PN500]
MNIQRMLVRWWSSTFIILLFLVLAIYIPTPSLAIEVQSSVVSEKSTNVVGLDMNFALMEVTFDSDLYMLQSISCSNFTCETPAIDCTCDYTSTSRCGQTVSGNPSCPACPTNTTAHYGNEEVIYQLCDYVNKPWIPIEANRTYSYENIQGPLAFRYKANTSYCEGIRLYASQEQGSFILFANTDNTETGRMIGYENPYLNNILNICPTDNVDWANVLVWTNDTYFISIIPTTQSISFSLSIFSAPISKPLPTAPKCTDLTTDHKCINDGELITGQSHISEQPNFYTFVVDRPMNLSIGCPALQEDIDFFISDDPSEPYPTAISQNIKWVYNHPVDDYVTLAIGPYENGTKKILYISIVPYYPSNYSCSVTSSAQIWPISIVNNSPSGGTYNIMGTARLLYPDGSVTRSDYWENTRAFFVSYPRVNINPLWPVPYVLESFDLFKKINFFETLQFNDNQNPPKNHTFQAAFILSYREDSLVIHSDINTIVGSKLQFLNTLVDSKGNPVDITVGFQLNNSKCDYDQFNQVLDLIKSTESQIFNSKSYAEVSTLRYMIDIYTLRDAWVGCMGQANDLLQIETVDTNQLSTICTYTPSDPEYQLDPCCNSTRQFFQCCIPRNVTVPTKSFVGVYNNLVDQQCSSYGCTVSILDDYYKSLTDVEDGACAISYADYQEFQSSIANTLRSCKYVYDRISCDNDSMCGNGTTCNLYSRYCEPSRISQDYAYIDCVLNSSSSATIYFLKSQNHWSTVDDLYNSFLSDDCVYHSGNFYRTRYTYETTANISLCYPPPSCVDETCEVEHDVCYDGYYGGYRWTKNQYSPEMCELNTLCPWIECLNDDPTCEQQCNTKTHYCGHCSNNQTFCHYIPDYNSEATCKDKQVCLLPNGDYQVGKTATECAALGRCTQACGKKCVGPSKVCIAPAITQANCVDANVPFANWNSTFGYCYNNYTQAQCTGTKFKWLNCPALASSECKYQVLGNDMCAVEDIPCATEQQCTSKGGSCSDSYFFDPANVLNYPPGIGKCVHGHYAYFSENTLPTCNYENEHDSPRGCFSAVPKVYTKTDCLKLGNNYTWWEQSTNKTTCESYFGCKIPDDAPFSAQNQHRFNEMTEEQCGHCDSNHEWSKMFQWTPARWLPGVLKTVQWLPAAPINVTSWEPAFDLEAFSEAMSNAYYGHVVDLLRSSAMCRMERLQETLSSIACSCSGPGGSQCFTSSAILLGTTQACALDSSIFKFSLGHLIFNPDSVPSSCNSVIVSQISKQLFKATTTTSLSSDFVSYKKPDNYAIYNSHGGLIGSLLNDGIKVQATGVNNYGVCLQAGELSSQFEYYDFATESVNDSSVLVPVDAEITATIREPGSPVMICANFSAPYQSYFPIVRVANWRDVQKEIFDRSATAMIYTLGAIFALNALWGIIQLGMVLYKVIYNIDRFKLVHLLIATVTLFITIRAIYFFMLPSGKLSQSGIADYILVVLPTFIYFTSFSIIVVLWYVIVRSKLSNNILSKFSTMIGVINIILYVLFIIIILVFNFSERKYSNDCGARLVVEQTNTTPQRIVSIFYAVVQAVISLIIGAAFVYLGGSIYLMMKFRKSVTTSESGSEQQQRIFLVTHTCSIGFILHCVFVLILVAANPSNIVFSFVGLIVTEIIPVMSILYSYNQGHLGGIRQSTNTTRMAYITPSKESFTTQRDTSMKSSSTTSMSSMMR